MQQISVLTARSTNIEHDFAIVKTIEIENTPFAAGGFGEVYRCLTINGKKVNQQQVIKLFLDNKKGSLQHNLKTTQRLQSHLSDYNAKHIVTNGKHLFDELPAFRGVPQFSFIGELNGVQVTGYSANDLSALGYYDFESILSDSSLLNRYQSIPLEGRLLLCHQLAAAFKILEKFNYIHADLKPGAIFINIDTVSLSIIDYDSGVVIESINDEPETWGAANDWVAPEIWQQQTNLQAGDKIQVDRYTDRWSVSIGIHYLISTVHPLFFLTELSPKITTHYFSRWQWPAIDKNEAYFEKANEGYYDRYLTWIAGVSTEIRDRLSNTINFGYRTPVARTSYADWEFALGVIQRPPNIKMLTVSSAVVINGFTVNLDWEVEHANKVSIDNGIGDVLNVGTVVISPKANATYTLTAIGFFGQVSQAIDVAVYPTPVIESLFVPVPDLTHTLSVPSISFSQLKLNFGVQINVGDLEETIDKTIQKHPLVFRWSKIIDDVKRKLLV